MKEEIEGKRKYGDKRDKMKRIIEGCTSFYKVCKYIGEGKIRR